MRINPTVISSKIMLFYANLTDYLFNRPWEFNPDNSLHLRGCDRPFLVLENEGLNKNITF